MGGSLFSMKSPLYSIRYLSIIFILFFSSSSLYALKSKDRFTLGGFFRTRFWSFYVDTAFPGDTPLQPTQNYLNYIDLFSRMNLSVHVTEKVHVHSVFDVFTVFGDSDSVTGGGLGRGSVNLVTRNLYGEFKPKKSINLSFGLQPFSLPGGYILARNGAGVKYEHRIHKKLLNLNIFWIKVIENSLTNFDQDGLGEIERRDDDIYSIGNKMLLRETILGEVYYVFRYDRDIDDGSRGSLHWLGIHSRSHYKAFIFDLSGIYNFGSLSTKSPEDSFFVNAALWATHIGYEFKYWEAGLRHEGATGRNIQNPQGRSSFQTISQSRGLSYIFVDDSGGLSIRRSGKLFGAHASAIELILKYFNDFDMSLKYFHHRSLYPPTGSASSSTHLGDELNTYLKYSYTSAIFLEFTTAFFWPNQGYLNWTGADSSNPVIEALLKVQINY